jgi:hypothetical protein
MEGIMEEMTKILKELVPRENLYCVWIREHEDETAPLIRVWIDPSLTAFESRAKANQPDATAPPETEAAFAKESTS